MELLNKKSAVPLYEQLKVEMTRLIVSNYFKKRSKFYSLSEIVKKYRVSQITARRVIRELVAEGYLKTSQGKKPSLTSSRSVPIIKVAVFFYSQSGSETINYAEKPWTSTIFSGIQERLIDKKALWTMVPVETAKEALKKLENIKSEHDAFICISSKIGEKLLEKFESIQRPYVQLLNENLRYNFVTADYYAGSAEIAEKAVRRGYKSFLYLLSGSNDNFEKMRGFQEALLSNNIPPQNIYIRNVGALDEKKAAEVFESFIKENNNKELFPLAVYSFGDWLSMGVLSACQKLGLKVPDEVGVAGSTGLAEAEQCVPPLTTMQIPMRKMGNAAADMIFEMLSSGTWNLPGIKLNVKIIERESL